MTEIGNVGLKPGIRDGFRDQTVYKCWGSNSNKTIFITLWSCKLLILSHWVGCEDSFIYKCRMMAYKKCIVLCYLLLWMYCLENKVLTFVSGKNYTEYNCTTSITGQCPLRSLQTTDISQHIFTAIFLLKFIVLKKLCKRNISSGDKTNDLLTIVLRSNLFLHSTKVHCSHFSSVFPLST